MTGGRDYRVMVLDENSTERKIIIDYKPVALPINVKKQFLPKGGIKSTTYHRAREWGR